ncbi:MAG: class I SAM-dependent methyltransferase [Clostridiales bacterium]|nr:class I SAM-dependent methyltransferase [Clostridiales bacterium]
MTSEKTQTEEIEAYFCALPSRLQRYGRYFDPPVAEDIPRRLFVLPWYRPLRDYAVFRMGFSVVTRRTARALKAVIGQGRVLEVMCGTGAWTAALRQEGIPVRATDDLSWMDSRGSQYAGWLTRARVPDVEDLDAVEAVVRYGAKCDFVLMSWPPLDDPVAAAVLRAMRRVNPACRMLYIGEGYGGSTAGSGFFRELQDVTADCPAMRQVRRSYRSWKNCGCSDTVYLLR